MKIHHIGYLVKNKEKSLQKFLKMGFTIKSDYIFDEFRKVYISFIEKDGYVIELVSPADIRILQLASFSRSTEMPLIISAMRLIVLRQK